MRAGLVLGHQGEHPEHDGAVRGGGVDQPVAQRPDADPAGLQGGDDVDEVAQVAAEPVDPPDDQGVARAQIGEAGRPLRPAGLRAAGPVGVDLQAVLGGERGELQLRVLVRGRHSVGFALPAHTAELLERIPAAVWAPAYDADGAIRAGAWVAELTGLLDLSGWPAGMRVIVRKERA